jgi:transcriptional regulator with PAS, ATPase and Fis domain
MVVNEIYASSMRSYRPIIKVNCGAIPPALFESELFGYEDGAFTGARRKGKPGFFELAHMGTLFLDEVGELPLEMQVKLLRVLQEGEIIRIGGSKPISVDVRIIAATNRDLWEMTEEGTFRQDLYYRLNVINIEVPPLRQRRDDIIPLVMHMLERFNQKYGKHKEIPIELGKVLRELPWRGNVRELENLIENLVVLCPEDALTPEHLPVRYQRGQTRRPRWRFGGFCHEGYGAPGGAAAHRQRPGPVFLHAGGGKGPGGGRIHHIPKTQPELIPKSIAFLQNPAKMQRPCKYFAIRTF